MLDIRWLEDLIVVAETRNLTKASEIRNVTQSGLSRRIQSLEHWVGAPLIDRRKSPLDLTEAGYKLLEVANDTLGRLKGARRAIREDLDERLRSIRFAAPHILSMTFFPRWIPAIQSSLGATRLSVMSDNLPGCASAFEDGSVDFVVCLADAQDAIFRAAGRPLSIEGCASLTIGRETLIPLSAPDGNGAPLHRLDIGPRLSTSYLGYSRECSLGWAVEQLIATRRDLPQLNALYENSLADGLRSMALSGLGVAWLPLTTTHNDILRRRLVRAGDSALDLTLDIRIYRPPQKLPRRAEELWTKLSTDGPGLIQSEPSLQMEELAALR
ncbi:DNA-binding transcriptional regulator, LysR family [Bosea sp. OK403]|uniref:LysR family transcriptional regulator n=1 Tax=Bosea sp. OK403 TaxID=1855286 RepID=UPI0008ED4784|nr:LysR family transcriptional regulator [Bosea sp. OK403]SFI14110.1 DNA-binding transcriptional regulator, LysR family [Bosea sp. OK403]